MKISGISNKHTKKTHFNVSFQRALRENEVAGYTATLRDGKNVVGQTGKSILIVHDACLPQSPHLNTGVGNLSSKDSFKFFQTMKNYLGVNEIEVLPQGPIKTKNGFYCAYGSYALPLSNHIINPELLTGKSFENLITRDDIKTVVNSNTINDKNSRVNFPNVVDDNSSFDNMLKKAYTKFQTLDEQNPLKLKFNAFVKENDDWMEPITKVDTDVDAGFFKFKQFLATEHLKIAKENLNKLGLKLCVDCEIGFSKEEVKAFSNAFMTDTYVGCAGWRLPALDYDNILNPESAAHKLLKRKVQLSAQRGDTIRFDVAWAYVTPKLTTKDGQVTKKEMGDSLVTLIEGWVKEVKGSDFDVKDLIHEYEAGPDDFRAMYDDKTLIEPLRGRKKVYSATYMSENWANNDAFINYRGWSPDEYVLGVGNHDPQPLRQIAEDIPEVIDVFGKEERVNHKTEQIKPLSRILNLSEEFVKSPVGFAKAKFAEAMMAKHNMVFYMDVFGRSERFDKQWKNDYTSYAYKIPTDYEKSYIDALREGFGFNPMDSLAKIFVAKGYDKTHPELYKKIVKYSEILVAKDIPKPVPQPMKKRFGKVHGVIAFCFAVGAGAYAYIGSKNPNINSK